MILATAYVSQMKANAAVRCSHRPCQSEAIHANAWVSGLLNIRVRIAERKKLNASKAMTNKNVCLAVEFVMLNTRTVVKKMR